MTKPAATRIDRNPARQIARDLAREAVQETLSVKLCADLFRPHEALRHARNAASLIGELHNAITPWAALVDENPSDDQEDDDLASLLALAYPRHHTAEPACDDLSDEDQDDADDARDNEP